VSAHNLGPPGNAAGPDPGTGARDDVRTKEGSSSSSSLTRVEFVALFPAGPDTPIYGSREWESLDRADVRRFTSVIRAAECWRQDGTDEAIRNRFLRELAENNWLTAWRLRRLSGDLSEAVDWSAIARWTPIAELRRLRAYGTKVAP
jgi:hypothetical protein